MFTLFERFVLCNVYFFISYIYCNVNKLAFRVKTLFKSSSLILKGGERAIFTDETLILLDQIKVRNHHQREIGFECFLEIVGI